MPLESTTLSGLTQLALGLVFPKACEICNQPIAASTEHPLCNACFPKIHLLDYSVAKKSPTSEDDFHFDLALACTAYEGIMRDLIHRYKFENKRYLGHFFAHLMFDYLKNLEKPFFFDAIAAVPLDWTKFKERGFNQSWILSKKLSDRLGVPELSNNIRRQSSSSPQFLLDKPGRKSNIKNVFRISDREPLKDKRLLLIDDILTTGHTASECARTLKNAGVSSVTVLALSRGFL